MININSLENLISYLTSQGVEILSKDKNSVRVTDGLILMYEDGNVIPTGFDEGWLYKYTNDVGNMLINYLF